MRLIATLLAACALAAAPPALAKGTISDDGHEFYENCTDSTVYMKGFCLGYVRGLLHGYEVLRVGLGAPACVPSSVTMGDLRDIVVRYVGRHPDDRDEPALVLFARAVNDKWGCV